MKHIPNAITGLFSSIVAYAAVLFTGVAIVYLIGLEPQSNAILQLGLKYLEYNFGAGLLGGVIGGNNRGYNSALVGGIVAGALAGAARILYVFFV